MTAVALVARSALPTKPCPSRMGLEKAHDHLRHGTEYVVSPDMLMHQQGIARRAGLDLKYIHVAQVLNGGPF